jgi:hypothetical protein
LELATTNGRNVVENGRSQSFDILAKEPFVHDGFNYLRCKRLSEIMNSAELFAGIRPECEVYVITMISSSLSLGPAAAARRKQFRV